jgi:hypothetical protein
MNWGLANPVAILRYRGLKSFAGEGIAQGIDRGDTVLPHPMRWVCDFESLSLDVWER